MPVEGLPMAKRKRKRKKEQQEGTSVLTMAILLMVFFAWLSWAIAASAYFGSMADPIPVRGRISGLALLIAAVATFLFNSIRLDALPDVFMNSLRHHQWHFLLFVVLEMLTVGFGIGVKWLETSLDRPRVTRRREWEQQ